jgi:hypothetical protein
VPGCVYCERHRWLATPVAMRASLRRPKTRAEQAAAESQAAASNIAPRAEAA